MSTAFQIVLTSCVTVFSGVVVFALGHFCVSLFVEPIHKLRSLINDIDDSLNFFEDVYLNIRYAQESRKEEAASRFKYQASQLKSMKNFIPWYRIWGFLRIVPRRIDIIKGSSKLVVLAHNINSIHETDVGLVKDIRASLGIKFSIYE
ncbi:hypothetical protein ACFLVX_02120 [Chloroflexota bacterium]